MARDVFLGELVEMSELQGDWLSNGCLCRLHWVFCCWLLSTPIVGRGQDSHRKESPSLIALGRATTYFTEPIKENGEVDYIGIINTRFQALVSPGNNAFVTLQEVIGRNQQVKGFDELLGYEPAEDNEKLFRFWEDPNSDEFLQASKAPWISQQHPEIAEWLRDNSESLQVVVEASLKSDYFSPWCNEPDIPLIFVKQPGLHSLKELSRALILRAMLNIGENRPELAWDDLMAVNRLARLVSRGSTHLEFAMGVALEELAVLGQIQLIGRHPASGKLALYMNDLERLAVRGSLYEKIDFSERIAALDVLCKLANRTFSLDKLFATMEHEKDFSNVPLDLIQTKLDWNVALVRTNEYYDLLVDDLKTCKDGEVGTVIDAPRQLSSEQTIRLLRESQFVERATSSELTAYVMPWIFESTTVSRSTLVRLENRAGQLDRHRRLALALAKWYSDNGGYPASLEELSASDQFRGWNDGFEKSSLGPLIYQRLDDREYGVGCRFYQYGENEQDDHGTYDDLVSEMNAAHE